MSVSFPELAHSALELVSCILTPDGKAGSRFFLKGKVCGRKTCPCATDADRRHGPYHEWSRLEDGRLVHMILSTDQAELMAEAIENYRDIQALLERWQRETESALLALRKRKGLA